MKNVNILVLLSCVLTMAFYLVASPASAALPKDHNDFLKNEDYKSAFEQFTAVMEEAKTRLSSDEYKALEKENEETIAASVKEDMETDTPEVDAYATAYWMRNEQVGKELRWDWLRKNAEDAQGFYRLKSNVFNGFLTLEKGDEKDEYAVSVFVVMKNEPYNSGDFEGLGKIAGNKMNVFDNDDSTVIIIIFNGETAELASSKAFQDSGLLGANVTIDGKYLREKK